MSDKFPTDTELDSLPYYGGSEPFFTNLVAAARERNRLAAAVENWRTTYADRVKEHAADNERHIECHRKLLATANRLQAACGADSNHFADVRRIDVWMHTAPRKPPELAFTEGPERQVAYIIEGLLNAVERHFGCHRELLETISRTRRELQTAQDKAAERSRTRRH